MVLGIIITLVITASFALSFILGYRKGYKVKKPLTKDEEAALKKKLMLEGMQNILNYDYKRALGGGK